MAHVARIGSQTSDLTLWLPIFKHVEVKLLTKAMLKDFNMTYSYISTNRWSFKVISFRSNVRKLSLLERQFITAKEAVFTHA